MIKSEQLSPIEKQVTVELLIELYEEVRPLLLHLGLTARQMAYRRDKIDLAKENELKAAFKWLQSFILIRVGHYHVTVALLPDERWHLLAAFGDHGLWEQEELKKAIMDLKEDWKNRPEILRRNPIAPTGNMVHSQRQKAKIRKRIKEKKYEQATSKKDSQ